MDRMRILSVWIVGVGFLASPLLTGDEKASAEQEKLLQTLQSDAASLFEKAKACQRLAVVGDARAVPVLAELLADEKLSHYARFGLEPIPDAAVDEVLRRAMGELDGELLVGVINSIGHRRDAAALDELHKRLEGPDAGVAMAAAAAVGRIGNEKSARILRRALETQSGARRVAIAEACLVCAEALDASEKDEAAVNLYDAVRGAEVPRHVRLAGLRGAIIARGADGVPLLVESLSGDDRAAADLALLVSREMPQGEVTRALVKLSKSSLPTERRALVIAALGDRGDARARPAVVEAARSESAETRLAAVRALEPLGDASCLPVLVEAAVASDEELANAARRTLARIPGENVDAAVVESLGKETGKKRAVLIEAAGLRQAAAAVPTLRRASTEEDETVRLLAIEALGRTIGPDELGALVERLIEPRGPKEAAAIQSALKSACARMPDRNVCAANLESSMEKAPVEARALLLGVFTSIGGEKALDVVFETARDSDDEKIRAAAVRALGDWQTEDAAKVLLDVTRSYENDEERRRSLGAFRDLVRRLGFPKEERIRVCVEGMDVARNKAEKKLILNALAGIPAPETLAVLTPYVRDPELSHDASVAVVTIAERIARSKREPTARALEVVLEVAKDEELLRRARRLHRQATGGR